MLIWILTGAVVAVILAWWLWMVVRW